MIDEQTLSDSEIINLDNGDNNDDDGVSFSNACHSSISSSNPSTNQKLSFCHDDDSRSGSSSVSNASILSSSSNSCSSSEPSTISSNSNSCSRDNTSNN